jgi:hypothetical protein
MKIHLFIALIIMLITNTLFAQEGELSLHLFGTTSLPIGDFGTDADEYSRVTRVSGFEVGDKIGLAREGLGIGAELIAPVWFRGLNWVLSTKVLVNGTNRNKVLSEYRTQFVADTVETRDHQNKSVVTSVDIEFGRWFNIPVMTGFRYDHHFSHRYTLYGTLQAGMNLSKAPYQKATVGLKDAEGTNELFEAENTKYSFARDFGYEVGIGFVWNQTYNFGIRYLALSNPRFDGTRTLSLDVFPWIYSLENEIVGDERSVSMLVVTFGIQLFR